MNYTAIDTLLEYSLSAVRVVEQYCGPAAQSLEQIRKTVFRVADTYYGDTHPFVYEKGTQDYLTTTSLSPTAVTALLYPTYHRNFASSVKYRIQDGEPQYTHSSWVYDPAAEPTQHHVYIFPTDAGGTDIYAHTETSVREGAEHLTETNQEHATIGALDTVLPPVVIDDV